MSPSSFSPFFTTTTVTVTQMQAHFAAQFAVQEKVLKSVAAD
ncbi:hypothetical protein [Leclercia adecarboxylata]|nr:hypothetical protein [Leclercia adecarboxylata]